MDTQIIDWRHLSPSHDLNINRPRTSKINIMIREVFYREKYPLLITTPKSFIYYGIQSSQQNDGGQTIQLSFKSSDQDTKTKLFLKKIHELDKFFHSKYSHLKLIPSIKLPTDPTYSPFIRVKIPKTIPLQVYDSNGNSQKLTYILPNSFANSMIYLKSIWINRLDRTIGLCWYLLQIKITPPLPIFDRCLINDDEECEADEDIKDNKNIQICSRCKQEIIANNGQHTEATEIVRTAGTEEETRNEAIKIIPEGYEKYYQMLKFKIPLRAVIQKCLLDGKDPSILNNPSNSHFEQISCSPPPPPPPPLPTTRQPTTQLSSTSRFVLGSTKILVTVDELQLARKALSKNKLNQSKNVEKLAHQQTDDPRVPSLNMILNSLKGLKKVNKEHLEIET